MWGGGPYRRPAKSQSLLRLQLDIVSVLSGAISLSGGGPPIDERAGS
jgi:hypothetical protein